MEKVKTYLEELLEDIQKTYLSYRETVIDRLVLNKMPMKLFGIMALWTVAAWLMSPSLDGGDALITLAGFVVVFSYGFVTGQSDLLRYGGDR